MSNRKEEREILDRNDILSSREEGREMRIETLNKMEYIKLPDFIMEQCVKFFAFLYVHSIVIS